MQLAEIGLNVPVELVVKLTEPEGVVEPVTAVSVTVAAQLVGTPACTGDGAHWTLVVVVWRGTAVTASLNEPELATWVESLR